MHIRCPGSRTLHGACAYSGYGPWPLPAGIFFKVLCFPLLFLLFATPVGEGFVPILMKLTAEIATALLQLSGIPFLRDGQYISLPGGEFVVADVCSGLRYLMTGSMVVVLFGHLSFKETYKTVALLVVTSLVSGADQRSTSLHRHVGGLGNGYAVPGRKRPYLFRVVSCSVSSWSR